MRMLRLLALAPWGLALSASVASAQPISPLPGQSWPAVRTVSANQPAAAPSLLDYVQPQHRKAVSEVFKNCTLSTKADDDHFLAHPAVYDWLLEHPDRASLAWRRLNIPCLEIQEMAPGRFTWKDPDHGSELVWETVGRVPQGMIWYASGKVKTGPLLPMVHVKAVAVLQAPRTPVEGKIGVAEFTPKIQLYLHSDSRAAQALLRILGPAASRMAEQGAEQLLLFFCGPARYIYRHPDELDRLLSPAKSTVSPKQAK